MCSPHTGGEHTRGHDAGVKPGKARRPRGRIFISALRDGGHQESALSMGVKGSDAHFGRDTDPTEHELDGTREREERPLRRQR